MTYKEYCAYVYQEFKTKWATPFFIALLLGVVFSHFYSFSINMSHSLDGTVYIVHKLEKDLKNFKSGDLVTYSSSGWMYPQGTLFTKKIYGLPNDVVTADGQQFFINNRGVGVAKSKSLDGIPLNANSFRGPIPQYKIWVGTGHEDSLDSRYEYSGLISAGQIVGKAYKLF